MAIMTIRKPTTKNDTYAYLRDITPALSRPYLKEVMHLAMRVHNSTTRVPRSKKGTKV
ncbi:MAG TPA: hypothetical protein VGF14_03330 [Alphaproteobacteria bacterium]